MALGAPLQTRPEIVSGRRGSNVLYVVAYRGHDHPRILPSTDVLRPVLLTVEESSNYQIAGYGSDPQWEVVGGNAWGYVRLKPNDSEEDPSDPLYGKRRMFTITMFHELHCLRLLNLAFDESDVVGEHHITHCLNYLRQMALCDSDLTLEPHDWEDRYSNEADMEQAHRQGATHFMSPKCLPSLTLAAPVVIVLLALIRISQIMEGPVEALLTPGVPPPGACDPDRIAGRMAYNPPITGRLPAWLNEPLPYVLMSLENTVHFGLNSVEEWNNGTLPVHSAFPLPVSPQKSSLFTASMFHQDESWTPDPTLYELPPANGVVQERYDA
ncbi:hypothetical protein PQX77_001784 [Marasmius sp. AFHP31]|nr:hypothetical protein PQX77_001784 [Marasmius sp. AFHP31]